MKTKILNIIHILTLLFLSQNILAQSDYDKFKGCGMEGNAKQADVKALNLLKNRYRLPQPSDFDNTVTLSKMLQKGNDETRFDVNKAVRITAYVLDVKPGSKETCNCRKKNLKDAHIEILADLQQANKSKRVIVETTPRLKDIMKKQGIDWETKTLEQALEGKKVIIEGWLFFDNEHLLEAENTDPGNKRGKQNWRATCWEIHPVTKIEVVH